MKIDNQLTVYILTPPSINGERSRWLLRYFGIKYKFNQMTLEPLALIPVLKYAPKATGSKYVYIVNKKSGLVFRDPHKLLEYLNPMFNEEIRLGEDDSEVFKEVMALSDKYVRTWGYATFGHLWGVFLGIMTHNVSTLNRIIFYVIYPLIALLLRVTLGQKAAQKAEEKLEKAFDLADTLFADGREFLNGERLSYGDIALSTNLSPLILPPEYGENGTYPAPEDLPSSIQAVVERFRQRPTGQYILNLYKNHRLTLKVPAKN